MLMGVNRRMRGIMKWALVVAACVAVLVASAAAATRVRWSGELGSYGNAVGMPVRVGSSFSVGMGELRPDGRIQVESVRLNRPTRGVELVGALLHPSGRGMTGAETQFPPTIPNVGMEQADGAVVSPETPAALVVGIRATRPGAFRVHGVEVLYRERWHGVDVRRRAHVGVEVVGCAVTKPARVPHCTLPEPTD
jgi:hypothetical protein